PPPPVGRLRQLRNHVSPAIVGHDDLDELRGQLRRLRDDPYARFRALRPGNDAGDVVLRRADRAGRAVSAPAPQTHLLDVILPPDGFRGRTARTYRGVTCHHIQPRSAYGRAPFAGAG